MTHYDYAVLATYFLFMLLIGWIFRRFVSNVSDYFRGGGKGVWWLVGGSAFMVQFSAWTFTGAAGMAYTNGWPIIAIYCGNILGFLLSALYFAPRFRQLRTITGIEAVRQRFGRTSEQVFTWLQMPLGILQAGIWLYALSKFFSAVFGLDITITIMATGIVVVLVALLGGSWGVLASDFIQVLILMPVCLVLTVFALAKIGGPVALYEQLPQHHFDLNLIFSQKFLGLWCIAMLLKQVTVVNNLIDANRFLAAKDNRHARNGALLGAALFVLGIIVWFIPPMAARVLYPDLTNAFPGINLHHIEETSFIAIARSLLPVGMMGLLVSGIFASTMSSMDAGLNKTAGIFIKNFYQPVIAPEATDRKLLRVGKYATLALGTVIVLVAFRMSTWENYSLFLLTQRVSILISMPILVPLFMGVFIKRTPAWAGWSTTLIGFIASIVLEEIHPEKWARRMFDFGVSDAGITAEYWRQSSGLLFIFAVSTTWFLGTTLLWKRTPEAQKNRVAEFTARLQKPVDFNREEGAANDHRQSLVVGKLCIACGGFIMLLALIPNPPNGRLAFIFCGLIPLLIGATLTHSAMKKTSTTSASHNDDNPRTQSPKQPVRTTRILTVLTPAEIADFLPGVMLTELHSLSKNLTLWNPAGRSAADFHALLAAEAPEILIACWKTPPLPPRTAPHYPASLRYVCYLCGSVKTIVTRAHIETGLIVTNWGGSISRIVAECALHHILTALRRTTHWTLVMHNEGGWKTENTGTTSLFEKNVGIHGFGLVSKELIQILRPFGARISVHAPATPADDTALTAWGATRAETIDALFANNDIIVELAPLTPQTRGIIGEKQLRLIRPGGAFINLGRGAVVEEEALIRVASEGKINFALDVFATEPLPPEHPLRKLRNVTLTPHIGGPTTDRRRDAGAFALHNLRAYLDDTPLAAQVTTAIYDASS